MPLFADKQEWRRNSTSSLTQADAFLFHFQAQLEQPQQLKALVPLACPLYLSPFLKVIVPITKVPG